MAVFDLMDIEQLEVLRGPQGTLFGKNTTAGVINISTRADLYPGAASKPRWRGRYFQTKGTISGPLNDELAGRFRPIAPAAMATSRTNTTAMT
jgi:iron complex outermembrane receptor protein